MCCFNYTLWKEDCTECLPVGLRMIMWQSSFSCGVTLHVIFYILDFSSNAVKNKERTRALSTILALHFPQSWSRLKLAEVMSHHYRDAHTGCRCRGPGAETQLTLWSWVPLERPQLVQPVGSSQHFMEPEGSLPSLQELSTCTYPEPNQSSPQHSHRRENLKSYMSCKCLFTFIHSDVKRMKAKITCFHVVSFLFRISLCSRN
jgi:hypothetical protein